MLRNVNHTRAGFTLVEIMIVVAIVAFLAVIAVSNFLRANKRSQATVILKEMHVIEGAKVQYTLENGIPAGTELQWEPLRRYFKNGTRLYNADSATDSIGNPITVGTPDVPPTISDATRDNFNGIISDAGSFWGSYANP